VTDRVITIRRCEYADVAGDLAELRWRAYVREGKWDRAKPASDFVDAWDARSLVVTASVEHKIIGSVRVTPRVTIAEIRSVHGFYGEVPLTSEDGLGEGSRLCVDPDYRGLGLFWTLAAEMSLLAREIGITQLVGGTTEALWPNWAECGFTYLGVSYPFASLNNVAHRLMRMDVSAVAEGRGVSDRFAESLRLATRR
jgi:GNAT superfamily N-acetyltransferase